MSETIFENDGTNVTSFTCFRGSKSKMKSLVQDMAGKDYYCLYDKEDFDLFPEMRTVEVYDANTMETKKFIKKFLAIKEVLQVKKKRQDSKF